MPAGRVSSRRLALPSLTPPAHWTVSSPEPSETLAITTPPIGGVKRSSRTDPEQVRCGSDDAQPLTSTRRPRARSRAGLHQLVDEGLRDFRSDAQRTVRQRPALAQDRFELVQRR